MWSAGILHRIARKCAGTVGRCSVTGQKHVHPKTSASRFEVPSLRDHARLPRLSSARAMVLTMNARRFQRTRPMGVIDLAPTCGSEAMVDGVRTAVVGSDRTSRVLDAGSQREDESFDVCCAGLNTIDFL